MTKSTLPPSKHPLADFIHRLMGGEPLLPDSPTNVLEVVGILKSYGVVLDAYSLNLCYIADHQFLVLFPFFKYFNGEISSAKLFRHLFHDRINFEYAEYCMKAMLWHGGGGLDEYLDSPEFLALAQTATRAKIKGNPFLQGLNAAFPEFFPEQVRQLAYYSGLGQFWRVMSDIFIDLKLSPIQKQEALVLADQKGPIWVSNYRISERMRVSSNSQRQLLLSISNPSQKD